MSKKILAGALTMAMAVPLLTSSAQADPVRATVHSYAEAIRETVYVQFAG